MDSLQRVSTVHQISMGATRLPLELQQQVYSYLDPKSFHSARSVCKWWRFASLDSITLAKQLRKLPILPLVDVAKSSPLELHKLFGEAAYTLLLGVHVTRLPDERGSMRTASHMDTLIGPRVTATSTGTRTVTLNDRAIALYDTSSDQPRFLKQRRLNDLKETIGNGPWLKVTPTSYHELALSSDGRLLAIAQERTIQIYDLSAEPDSFTVNEYISSAAGHYIQGLEFEQEDHVLRVRLSGKGAVLYLGTPPADCTSNVKATINHWKSKAGLKHTFLDSAVLSLTPSSNSLADHLAWVSGLQLLRPCRNGFLFAAQKYGGNESSHYVLGHVKVSSPAAVPGHSSVEPASITSLARLESFLSAWDYTLSGGRDDGYSLWESMPSAHEHHPSFALGPQGDCLVVAERDKKRIRAMPSTQLFVYRLPSMPSIEKMIEEAERQRSGRWATLSTFLDRLESDKMTTDGVAEMLPKPAEAINRKHRIGRIPLCMGTVQGQIKEMRFESVDNGMQKVTMLRAVTAETTKRWLFAETLC